MVRRGRPVRSTGPERGDYGAYDRALGEQVTKLRKERGWTSQELAKRWRKTAAQVTHFEKGNGQGPAPRLETLNELAMALHAPPSHPMTLLGLLLPVIAPDEAEEVVAEERRRWYREMREFQQKKWREYFAALDSEQAQWFFESIALLVLSNQLADVQVVAAIVHAAAQQLWWSRHPLYKPPEKPPVMWKMPKFVRADGTPGPPTTEATGFPEDLSVDLDPGNDS